MLFNFDKNVITNIFNHCKECKCSDYICDSEDINEELEHGDYLYYYVPLYDKHSWILYMESTHPWGLPNRTIVFSDIRQIHMEEGNSEVAIIPVNMEWYKVICLTNDERIRKLKELLESSNRPRIGRVC